MILDEDADVEMARHLIGLGASINHVDAPEEKWTPLALALRDGRTEIAELLLDSGAKVIAKDSSGNTPLHYAMHCLGYDHIPQDPLLEMVAALLAQWRRTPGSRTAMAIRPLPGRKGPNCRTSWRCFSR